MRQSHLKSQKTSFFIVAVSTALALRCKRLPVHSWLPLLNESFTSFLRFLISAVVNHITIYLHNPYCNQVNNICNSFKWSWNWFMHPSNLGVQLFKQPWHTAWLQPSQACDQLTPTWECAKSGLACAQRGLAIGQAHFRVGQVRLAKIKPNLMECPAALDTQYFKKKKGGIQSIASCE